MSSNNRRSSGIVVAILLIAALGVGAFVVGLAFGHGGVANEMPMRAYGPRYSWFGPLAWLAIAVLVGAGIGLAWAYVRRPEAPPAPPSLPPAQGPPPAGAPPVSPAAPADAIEGLRQLAALHTDGKLTDEEFAAAKRQILGL